MCMQLVAAQGKVMPVYSREAIIPGDFQFEFAKLLIGRAVVGADLAPSMMTDLAYKYHVLYSVLYSAQDMLN